MSLRALLRAFNCAGLLIALLVIYGCGTAKPLTTKQPDPRPSQPVAGIPAPFAPDPDLMAQLRAELDKLATSRSTASAPSHGTLLLTAAPTEDGALRLNWQHNQRGDYDLNGTVSVSDLSVLGGYFGLTSSDPLWPEARRADGDKNGVLSIADISPLAASLGEATREYLVEVEDPADSSADSWTLTARVPSSDCVAEVLLGARTCELILDAWVPNATYRVTAVDAPEQRGVSATVTAASLRGDWWMEGRDGQHTSLSAHAGPETGHIAWQLELQGAGFSGPVLDRLGNVYVGSNAGLNCVRPSGDVAWTYATPSTVASTAAIGHNGFIYFGCEDGVFRALRPGGELAWLYSAGGPIHSATAIGPEGRIYFGCADSKLYCLEPDGQLAWTWSSPTTGSYWRKSVSFDSTGRIIVPGPTEDFDGFDISDVYLLNADGSQVGTDKLLDALDTPLITSLVLDYGGAPVPVAVTAESYGGAWGKGGIRATRLEPAPDGAIPIWPYGDDDDAAGSTPALLPDGSGMFYARDNGVGLFDTSTLQTTSFFDGMFPYTGPVVVDYRGVCYTGLNNYYGQDNVLALRSDGSVEWSARVFGSQQLPIRPALDDRTLYLPVENGLVAIGGTLSGAPPADMGEIGAGGVGTDKVRIQWEGTNGAESFAVYREGTVAPLAVLPRISNDVYPYFNYEYVDTGLAPGTSYTYYVVASNRAGDGAPSPSATGTTKLERVTGVAATDDVYPDRIEVTWEKVANATGYRIYRDNIYSGLIAEVGDVASYADTGVIDWDDHAYSVVAINPQASGEMSLTDSGSLARGTGPAGPGEWAMHDHDLAQTRRSRVLGPAAAPAIASDAQLALSHAAVVGFADDGSAVCGLSSSGGVLNADGTLRFTHPASFYFSSVAPDGALVCHKFRSDSSPMLTILNPDGTERTRFETLTVYGGSPLGGADYIGAEPFAVTRFDLAGGVDWRYVLPEFERSPLGSPPLAAADGSVYFATGPKVKLSGTWPSQGPPGGPPDPGAEPPPPPLNYVYALNPDGSFRWRYQQAGYINETALGSDGTVYVSTYNGQYFTNSTTGRIIAIAPDGSEAWDYDALEANRLCLAADGKLVFCYADGVQALHPDGSLAWEHVTDVWTSDLLLDAAGNSYFFTAAQDESELDEVAVALHSLDAAGGLRWSLPVDARSTNSLALRDDGALVLTLSRQAFSGGSETRCVILQ